MAFKAPLTQSKTEYKQVPAGSHVARVFQLIDLGTQTSTFKDDDGNNKKIHKIIISFEVPNQKLDDGSPMTIGKEFSLTMGAKANLRKFIQDMLGIKLSDVEAKDFDLEKLIGETAIISVAHVPSSKDPSKKYANITGAMPLMDGMSIPDAVNKPLVFSIADFDKEVFDLLPEWVQKKIALPPGINMSASANDDNQDASKLLA